MFGPAGTNHGSASCVVAEEASFSKRRGNSGMLDFSFWDRPTSSARLSLRTNPAWQGGSTDVFHANLRFLSVLCHLLGVIKIPAGLLAVCPVWRVFRGLSLYSPFRADRRRAAKIRLRIRSPTKKRARPWSEVPIDGFARPQRLSDGEP